VTKIGDKLWTRDTRDHRSKWEEHEIIAETKQSWLMRPIADWSKPAKVNKKTMDESLGRWGSQRWYTDEGMRAHIFIQSNRGLIADRIRGETDTNKLRMIADLLGMNVGEP